MKALVAYGSLYGNTAKVAEAVAAGLGPGVAAVPVDSLGRDEIAGVGLLIVAAPTHGGRPMPAVRAWLDAIPVAALNGVGVAAFDTRLAVGEQGIFLRLLMRVIGFAAPRMAAVLEAKGGRLVSPPEGFIVLGKEGPLREGELERAEAWGGQIAESAMSTTTARGTPP